MSYLYCNCCEEIFREEDAKELWESDGYGMKTILACPECRSDDISDAGICLICGRPLKPGNEVCEDCLQTLHKEWVRFVEKVMDLRYAQDEGLSTDYLDCEQTAIDYLSEIGVI